MLNPQIKPYDLRGGPRAKQPKVNTTSCGLYSFTYQVAKLWNEMPSSIKEATSLLHFKSLCQAGRDSNATVVVAFYGRHMMFRYFISYILFIGLYRRFYFYIS